jgi:SAM-dependent methyltransferase
MSTEHWPLLARSWEQSGSPLRPCQEDEAAYFRLAREWMDQYGTPRVLLLGVTPEIYRLPWPEERSFRAIDRTAAMIEHVWPGPRDEATQAGWLDLPLPSGSRDLAFCDGGLHLLDFPHSQKKVVDRLHDVVAPGGRCIFRLFVPPPERESPEAVMIDLFSGRIGNLNILKLRLGMALQESGESGVAVRDVWQKLRGEASSWDGLASRLGWPLDYLQTIDAYRDSQARYHFVSVDQVRELFCAEGQFIYRGHHTAAYPLSERCPLIVFERR